MNMSSFYKNRVLFDTQHHGESCNFCKYKMKKIGSTLLLLKCAFGDAKVF
jgi:hypothetical protein